MTTAFYVGVDEGSGIIWRDVSAFVSILDLVVSDGIGATQDGLQIGGLFPVTYTSPGNLPLAGQLVRVVVNDVKVFEGFMPSVRNRWQMGGISIDYPLVGTSYAALLSNVLVTDKREEEETAGARIRFVLSEYGGSFGNDLSQIEGGPTIPPEEWDYQSIASIISKISASYGYLWYVDFDKRVHFFADLDQDAPKPAINLDTDTDLMDAELEEDASGIANVIIVKDFTSKNANRLNHETQADGSSSFFGLPMPPFSVEDTDVYVKPEGGSSWNQYNVVPDPLDGSEESTVGTPGTAYLCTFNWGVRFPTSDMPGPGDTVRADYNPEEPERVIVVVDDLSIQEFARREGTDGKHMLVVSAPDFHVEDDQPVYDFANLILSRKAWPIITGSFRIRTQSIGEWAPGQTFTVVSAVRDIYDRQEWVRSGFTNKEPVRVWATLIKRRFEMLDGALWELDEVQFSSQPWEA